MDTTWFAVDRDGHVGLFSSGEDGHVPDLAARAEQQELQALLLAAPGCAFANRFGREPSIQAESHHVPVDELASMYEGPLVLYVRADHWAVPDLMRASPQHALLGQAVVLLIEEPHAYATEVELVHLEGACLGCFAWEGWPEDHTFLGVFAYGDCDDRRRLYERFAQPRVPLHVDQLPPAMRQRIAQVQYGSFCFAETSSVLPLAHHAVLAYWPAYLDAAKRTIRPVPGHEKSYADVYERMREEARRMGWDIEKPK
jgi:hypothetical protein